MLNKIKILVTGSNGQLGWELQQLSKNRRDLDFHFFDKQNLDIANFAQVNDVMTEIKPDYLVNCAAYTAVDQAEDEVEKAFLINGTAVGNLAKICKIHKATLIHISTDYVFDGTAKSAQNPEDVCNPIGVYGKSKRKGELNIISESDNAIIIRTAWVFSSHGKNFVKTMLRLAKDRNSINVVADQIGAPTYAHDLAQNIVGLISNRVKPKLVEIHHFTNEGECSWAQFAQKIFELAKLECGVNEIKTEDYPTKAQRPKYSVLNTKSLFAKYPFLKNRPWQAALKECLIAIGTN